MMYIYVPDVSLGRERWRLKCPLSGSAGFKILKLTAAICSCKLGHDAKCKRRHPMESR